MTLIAVLLYANLASPDQPIDRPVPHAYGVRDPQFRRTMNQLPDVATQLAAVDEFFGTLAEQDARLSYEVEAELPQELAA